MSQNVVEQIERELDEGLGILLPYALRVARSVMLASIAAWLSYLQQHADYSELVVFAAVFLLSIITRYHWVAGVLIVWLAGLYLVTPEMVAALKAWRN